jgi:hypothetical protein
VIELKIRSDSLDRTIADGLTQTAAYLEESGAAEAHLVISDRDDARSWSEKIFRRTETMAGRPIAVWGM